MSDHPRLWVSCPAAAAALGIAKRTVRERAAAGRLPSREVEFANAPRAYWIADDEPDPSAPVDMEWMPASANDDAEVPQPVDHSHAHETSPAHETDPFGLDEPPGDFDEPTVEITIPAHVRASVPRHRAASVHLTAVSSDWHIPYHDKFAWHAWLRMVADKRPDRIILLGDILDLASMSSHGPVSTAPHAEPEIQAGRQALAQIRDIAPDAELWFFEGNHEERLRRRLADGLPTAASLLTLQDLLRLDTFACRWHPFPEKKWFGNVAYKHACGESIHYLHAALIAEDSSLVIGHTHRPKAERKITGSGRFIWGMGLGCGAAVKQRHDSPHARSAPDGPDWMRGKSAPWVHATGLVSELPDGRTYGQLVDCIEGAIVIDGRIYDGRAP